MARESRFSSGEEPMVEPIDLNVSGSYFASYHERQSVAARRAVDADDPLPIFLYDEDEEPQPPDVSQARFGAKTRRTMLLRPRILKLGILAACAAALVFGILSVENPLSLFPNAKASLTGALAGQPGAPRPAVETASITPASITSARPPIAGAGPTRDQIAIALRSAHQGPPEIHSVAAAPPPPVAAAPVRRLDGGELAALMKRANGLIEIGDFAAARLLLERAADAQEPSAAFLLAQTYDPAVLGKPDARSITPDPAMARRWYQKAAQFGSPVAQQRLAQMQN